MKEENHKDADLKNPKAWSVLRYPVSEMVILLCVMVNVMSMVLDLINIIMWKNTLGFVHP